MPLTCECSDDYEWMYVQPDGYDSLPKPAKCSSCRRVIAPGKTVAIFETMQYDENGDEQYGSDMVMCEGCSDLFFSLQELGFCISPDESMKHLLEEYIGLRAAGEFS